jgi:hypothetical protein
MALDGVALLVDLVLELRWPIAVAVPRRSQSGSGMVWP